MPERPNPCNLKLVVLCDPEDESCCVWRHNLSPEDARQKLDELRNEGLFAFTVDQRSHHAGKYPDDCTLCVAELTTSCLQDMS